MTGITDNKATSSDSLNVVDKLREIPIVEYATQTTQNVYGRVKASNSLINKTLETTENLVSAAVTTAAPYASILHAPIQQVDEKLCKGIDVIQDKVPIVKEQPGEIYEKAKNYINSTVQPAVNVTTDKITLIKDKTNDVLKTSYGNIAMNGLDTTSKIADKIIDYCLPPTDGEQQSQTHSNAECDDKVIHAVHTVGALSNKVGTRVYRKISETLSSNNQNSGPPPIQMESVMQNQENPKN